MKRPGLFVRIRRVVRKISRGKVATYGQIARLVGTRDARKVGWALWGNDDPKIPCHRVVKADGTLAPNYSLEGWLGQKRRLSAEGVKFSRKNQVDLKRHLWRSNGEARG